MQYCQLTEDDDGDGCRLCWENYFWHCARSGAYDPYASERRTRKTTEKR